MRLAPPHQPSNARRMRVRWCRTDRQASLTIEPREQWRRQQSRSASSKSRTIRMRLTRSRVMEEVAASAGAMWMSATSIFECASGLVWGVHSNARVRMPCFILGLIQKVIRRVPAPHWHAFRTAMLAPLHPPGAMSQHKGIGLDCHPDPHTAANELIYIIIAATTIRTAVGAARQA